MPSLLWFISTVSFLFWFIMKSTALEVHYVYIHLFLDNLISTHPYFYIFLFLQPLIPTYPYFYIHLFLHTLISTHPYFYTHLFLRTLVSTYAYFCIHLFLHTLISTHPDCYVPLFLHTLISTYTYFYTPLFLHTLISTDPYFYIPLFLNTLDLFRFISAATCPSFRLPTYPMSYNLGFILMHFILLWVIFTTINCCFVLLSETIRQDSVCFYIDSLIYKFIFLSKSTSEVF